MSALDLDAPVDLDELEAELRDGKAGKLGEIVGLHLITRLRAAEARTAWNYDLDAAPRTWVLACEGEIVYKAAPCGDEWVEVGGRTIKPRCWQSLPAAPEAP